VLLMKEGLFMGKKKKRTWTALLWGCGLSWGIYLGGLLLLAGLLTKGVAPMSVSAGGTAALCGVAVLAGGMLAATGSPWGPLPSALLHTALFATVLIGVGAACWQGIDWTGHGGMLLVCVLVGGGLAGLLSGRRGRRRRRK
jgi:hypothetical protein